MNHNFKLPRLSGHATLLAMIAATATVPALAETKSEEGLLNLLQRKGLLTEAEVKDLREEADQNFTKSYQAKTGLPDWVTSLKLGGDFRGRFEGIYGEDPAFMDRNRFRYRARFGLIATLKDNFEVGLRLTSAEAANGGAGGDPISGNASFQDNASKKFVYIDLAYAKWIEVKNDTFTGALTFGKMENPFVFSDLVFDHDYTPEGIAQQFTYNLNSNHALKLNLGGFSLDGNGANGQTAYLLGAQTRFDSKWSKQWQTTAGLAGLAITEAEALVNGNLPNQNRGNTRSGPNSFGPGALTHNYNPIVADAAVSYSLASFPGYTGAVPIKLSGDYMNNLAVSSENQAYSFGLTFGKAAKRGQWELGYRWKYLEGDSWFEELVDSDFGAIYQSAPDSGGAAGYGAGTNVRGHVLKAAYAPTDSLTVGITYYLTELINPSPSGSESGAGRLQVDATWKF